MELQNIDLHSAVTALSCSLDLVGVDEVKHGKRVAIMAYRVAVELGWPQSECLSILHAGMLHDCGVAKIKEHRQLTATLEWEGAEGHALRGAEYLSACPPLAYLSDEVRYHHTHWDELLQLSLSQHTRLRANLLFLADRADVLQVPFLNSERILPAAPEIVATLQNYAGTLFAPELVEAFSRIAGSQAFWLAMDPDYLDEDLRDLGDLVAPTPLDYPAQRELARLFSRVVDAKSPYTEQHSERVALVAKQLAQDFGLGGSELAEVEIAGLLHDLGKLRVSEDIIDKTSRLTEDERACMQRHSYDTYRILQRVFSDSKIPMWAGFHHENLLGKGYPFKSHGISLDLECRIITVADIFQALAQNRPYRKSMALPDILRDLDRRVEAGELDAIVVAKLRENAESYYLLATG